jgi:hypothetical protein
MSEMDVNIARIRDSFSVTSLSPVTIKKAGNFMDELEYLFTSAQEKMTQAPGMPEGVFTMNPAPEQTLEGLNITAVPSPCIPLPPMWESGQAEGEGRGV